MVMCYAVKRFDFWMKDWVNFIILVLILTNSGSSGWYPKINISNCLFCGKRLKLETNCSICSDRARRSSAYLGHRMIKCSEVSYLCPHKHWVVSEKPTLNWCDFKADC